jgi:hypothetical protein
LGGHLKILNADKEMLKRKRKSGGEGEHKNKDD